MTKRKDPNDLIPRGRPTLMTEQVIAKLEQSFSLGCTDREACLVAGISMDTLYYYQNKNPDFCHRKELLKENPILKARTTVVNHLSDPDHAEWYLERKARGEFATKQSVELTGKDGEPLKISVVKYAD